MPEDISLRLIVDVEMWAAGQAAVWNHNKATLWKTRRKIQKSSRGKVTGAPGSSQRSHAHRRSRKIDNAGEPSGPRSGWSVPACRSGGKGPERDNLPCIPSYQPLKE